MRTLLLSVVIVAGCSSSDPCAGRSGTCIALTIAGSVSGIDALAVTVDQPSSATRTTPTMALSLPVTLGLNLPATVAGVVNIDVTALSGTATVGEGSAQANVANERGAATVTLSAAGVVGDMAGGGGGDGPIPEVPSAPTNVVASSGNAQATVTWSAPSSNGGGSAITSYTIVSSPGGITTNIADGNSTMATISGLTNDTPYTFAVNANNAAGAGPAATSNQVTPTATPMVPSAPTNVTAIADVDHGAHVSWTASDNHGSPISNYTIVTSPGGTQTVTPDGVTTSMKLLGLTPGSMYTFTLTATNGIGTSLASSPSSAIMAATLPGAPTAVMASDDGSGGATVTWAAPAGDGYSAIAKYTVTTSPGGATATTPDGKTLTAQISGLTAGTSYTFTVVATNLIGDGPPSSASPSLILPMHDTLAIATSTSTAGTIDFYDGYNSLANNTSTPSRSVSVGYQLRGLTLDPTNSVVYAVAVVSGAYKVYGWLHAATINGDAPAPDITLNSFGMMPIGVDPVHKKFYATNDCTATSLSLLRFAYTNPTDLNTATTEATLTTTGGCGQQVWVNPTNGDVWFAANASGSDGGVCQLAAAYGLATSSSCTRTFTVTPQSGSSHSYAGVVYTPVNGGTIYTSDSGQGSIDWLSNADSLTSGNYTATGNLFGLGFGNLALDGSLLLLGSGSSVQAWTVGSVSGSAVKTMTTPHAGIAGMAYAP